jgi:hypothetical protein
VSVAGKATFMDGAWQGGGSASFWPRSASSEGAASGPDQFGFILVDHWQYPWQLAHNREQSAAVFVRGYSVCSACPSAVVNINGDIHFAWCLKDGYIHPYGCLTISVGIEESKGLAGCTEGAPHCPSVPFHMLHA